MFKELLTSEKKLDSSSKNSIKNQEKVNLKFKEILCPKTCQPLSSKQCKICSFKKEFHRAHESGLSLVTMICMFASEEAEKV